MKTLLKWILIIVLVILGPVGWIVLAIYAFMRYRAKKRAERAVASPVAVVETGNRSDQVSPSSTNENVAAVVDLNSADFDRLLTLPGIGAAEAKLIMDRRTDHPFASLDDLADFLALKPHKAEQLRKLLVFSQRENLSPRRSDITTTATASPPQTAVMGRIVD